MLTTWGPAGGPIPPPLAICTMESHRKGSVFVGQPAGHLTGLSQAAMLGPVEDIHIDRTSWLRRSLTSGVARQSSAAWHIRERRAAMPVLYEKRDQVGIV